MIRNFLKVLREALLSELEAARSVHALSRVRISSKEVRVASLTNYVSVIEDFLQGEIEPLKFERMYFDLYKNEKTNWTEGESEVLFALFAWLDDFNPDPETFGDHDLNGKQIRSGAEWALAELKELMKSDKHKVRNPEWDSGDT